MLSPGLASPASADDGDWRPPEVDMDMLPDGHDGQPLQKNKIDQEQACIKAPDERSTEDVLSRIPWGQKYLQLDKAREIASNDGKTDGVGVDKDGNPMTVAVVDTGVRDHPWLTVKKGGDYVSLDKQGPGLHDCDGHGTMVAGIIAAHAPSSVKFQGVAPDAEIFPVRQSSDNYKEAEDDDKDDKKDSDKGDKEDSDDSDKDDDSGTSGAAAPGQGEPDQEDEVGDLETLAHAVKFAAENKSVDVMNISIDNCTPAGTAENKKMRQLHAAIHWAVNKKDVVVVASAGNADDSCKQNNKPEPRTIVAPPLFSDDVLTAGAISDKGDVTDFSMHGPWVDVAAPGNKILSLDPAPGANSLANRITDKNGEQHQIQGTSYSAPYVSGVATLVRAKYPDMDAHEVMQRIKDTAQHPAEPGGHNQYVGYGVVNPVAALTTSGTEEASNQGKTGPGRADLPDPVHRNWTPVVVALGGAGGALIALLITLFTVHTIRRNQSREV